MSNINDRNKIAEAWNIYLGVFAEGNKLFAEGDKLYAEGSKLCAEGDKLFAEGDKLCAEGNNLHAEGSKLFAEGRIAFFQVVIDTLGNVKTKWLSYWDKVEIAGAIYTNNLNDDWSKDTCEEKVVEIEGRKYKLVEVK